MKRDQSKPTMIALQILKRHLKGPDKGPAFHTPENRLARIQGYMGRMSFDGTITVLFF